MNKFLRNRAFRAIDSANCHLLLIKTETEYWKEINALISDRRRNIDNLSYMHVVEYIDNHDMFNLINDMCIPISRSIHDSSEK